MLPELEKSIKNKKREMVYNLTNTVYKVIEYHYNLEKQGLLTKEEAKKKSISIINYLRYGPEMKDYFWINNMDYIMIVHPYRKDLIGQNQKDVFDREGKFFAKEIIKIVKTYGEGFVDYLWQWKDDKKKIVPKISFVKGFKPWGWVIGTGLYIEDLENEVSDINQKFLYISLFI